jgi:hypothetical protein
MTASSRHPLVERYLCELHDALSELPAYRRAKLVAEIEEHLDETAPPGASDAEVADAIDRLGDAGQVAEAERERSGFAPYEAGWVEWVTIPLLLVGGIIVPLFGWLVGVVLLWWSKVWTVRDKLWGTLLLPGGFLPALAALLSANNGGETCSGGTGQAATCTGQLSTQGRVAVILLLVVCLVAPVVTAVRLGRKLRP